VKRNPIWSERKAARVARLGATEAKEWAARLRDLHPDETKDGDDEQGTASGADGLADELPCENHQHGRDDADS